MAAKVTDFYRKYWDWLENGAPDGEPFYRSCGLCLSVEDILQGSVVPRVEDDMREQFKNSGLSPAFPFGEYNYEVRSINDTQHLDPKRLQWVEDHLKPEFTGEY